jgi:V/A-type H+-transporting ATPase subunit E
MSETGMFTADILNAAKEKAQVIINEAEVETQRALEQSRMHSAREAEDLLSNARADAEGVKRRRMSEVRQRLNLQEQLAKSKIISDVLEQTRARVTETVKDENRYFAFLVNLVSSGVKEIGLSDVVVHLNKHDLARIDRIKLVRDANEKLGKSVKIEIAKEPTEAIGGVIVSSKDGKTRIVNTLDQRFEALEPDLLIQASKILFAG